MTRLVVQLVTAWGVIGIPSVTLACSICMPIPTLTLADRILQATDVVLARSDPADPFSLRTVEQLRGHQAELPAGLFVDSWMRRALSVSTSSAALVVHDEDRDAWTVVCVADESTQQLIKRILARASEWQSPEADAERCRFFASLLDHPQRRIREAAYLEIARAPYPVIRELAAKVDMDSIQPMLERPEYADWRPLGILLLALQKTVVTNETVRQRCNQLAKLNSSVNLAAWLTALIEIDGHKGIEWIENEYLLVPSRTSEEVVAVQRALALHGQFGQASIQSSVREALRIGLVEDQYSLAELTKRLDPQIEGVLSDFIRETFEQRAQSMSRIDILTIETYFSSAGQTTPSSR